MAAHTVAHGNQNYDNNEII